MNRGRTQKFFNQREITAKAMRSLVEARCVFLSHEDIRVRLSVALVVQPLCLCCKDREHIFRFDGQHRGADFFRAGAGHSSLDFPHFLSGGLLFVPNTPDIQATL